MDQQQKQFRWRPTRQVLWVGGIVGVIALLLILIRLGYAYRWTGFGQYKVNGEVEPFKTLWDWLDLLIVPIVLALGGYLFTRSENQRTQKIAHESRQDDTLQAYLDGMAQLLTDKDRPLHRAQLGDSLSTVARARTLTVLPRLDGDRKARVVQFLYESDLIITDRPVFDLRGAKLRGAELAEADLNYAHLLGANLSGANLSGAYLGGADLRAATLREANLSKAHLEDVSLYTADLSEANLNGADLEMARLSEANLSRANLSRANLSGASLSGTRLIAARLSRANLSGARLGRVHLNLTNAHLSHPDLQELPDFLEGAYLSNADLSNVQGITVEELEEAESLKGATMPNGQKYEDWLKSKGRGEDGENSGPS